MERLELVGRMLGEFELMERLGGGGFADLFRAHQASLARDAVIKVLKSTTTPIAARRFLHEAQLASKLDHPYAAHIYAFGAESDGLQWIAMELVRGTSLADLLVVQGKLPISRFVPLFEAICQVVQAAHEAGVVHRDLKPANVMVVSRGGTLLPKLLDFGIARASELPDDATVAEVEDRIERLLAAAHTIDGSDTDRFNEEFDRLFVARSKEIEQARRERQLGFTDQLYVGSPGYMAPELWIGPQASGPPCDIYALGCLVYECLTGSVPFTGEHVLEVARAHLTAPLPPLDGSFPPGLHAALAKAMAKRTRDRFPDAISFYRAVADACAPAQVSTLPRMSSETVAPILARAPQPIAETLTAAEVVTRADEARARYRELVDVTCHYIGLLALAAHGRIGHTKRDSELPQYIARLARSHLEPRDWIELAVHATRSFARVRDAFPVPEIVDICHAPDHAGKTTAARLLALLADVSELPALVEGIGRTLPAVFELFEYDLAVGTVTGGEQWLGPRRHPRMPASPSASLTEDAPVLLDQRGAPVLSLWPLAKPIRPTPGADRELFFVAGSGRYGARLVAYPAGYERQDPDLAAWLSELAGGLGTDAHGDAEERAPYRGLASFSATDSDFFFGRERESEYLANHLRARSFAAVVGPSGAGKSSFVQAGVAPMLPSDWRVVVMRPGASPFATLTERLAAHGLELYRGKPAAQMASLDLQVRRRKETLLLLVDQAEELVTLTRDEGDRAMFAEFLASVADEDRVRVVLTLRDDFLMRMQRLPGLGERLPTGLQLLGTPSRTDLRRILAEPARRMGYTFDDDTLIDEMVAAVVDNPSALALLSFTAAQLWELRDRQFKKLRRKVYVSLGGVGGALAQHAEDVIQQMTADEREVVREAFRVLVTSDGTRAVIGKAELYETLGVTPQAVSAIEKLVQARLLVTGESAEGVTVEVTHEALLVSWPRLVAWRREDAENARMRDQLRASARQWDTRGRQRGLLWRGDVLVEYRLWRARYRGRITELEEAFGQACLREDARSARRRRVAMIAAFTVLSAAAVVSYGSARHARASERDAREKTLALLEEQGRRDLLDHHPLRAALPLTKATALGGRDPALRFLLARTQTAVESQGSVMRGHRGFVRAALFSADGARVITSSEDNTARVWDAANGALLSTAELQSTPMLAASRDHAFVVVAARGEVTLRTGRELAVVAHWPLDATPTSAAVNADGSRVIVGDAEGRVHVLEGGGEQTLVVHSGPVPAVAISTSSWASGGEDGAVVVDGTRTLLARGAIVSSLAFSVDGARLVSGSREGLVRVWALPGGSLQVLAGHALAVRAVDVAGAQIASASDDGTVRLWTVGSTKPPLVLAGHEGRVLSVAFDPDGKRLVTCGDDATLRLWDAATGTSVAALDAHQAEVWRATFSPSGDRVVSASFDTTARIWKIPPSSQQIPTPPVRINAAAIDRTGSLIVTGGEDGKVRLLHQDGRVQAELDVGTSPVRAVAIAPDGSRVVAGTEKLGALWSTGTRSVIARLEEASGGVFGAAFSPDGTQVATGDTDGIVRVFDASTGAVVRRQRGHTGPINGVAYSPDGALLASVADDHTLRLWDARTGTAVRTIGPLSSELNAVAFAPSGDRVAVVGTDGRLSIHRVATGELVASRTAHHMNALAVTFSRDGARIVTTSHDHQAIVWDSDSLRELARVQRHTAGVTAAVYAPGTDNLLTAGADGTLWLTDLGLAP